MDELCVCSFDRGDSAACLWRRFAEHRRSVPAIPALNKEAYSAGSFKMCTTLLKISTDAEPASQPPPLDDETGSQGYKPRSTLTLPSSPSERCDNAGSSATSSPQNRECHVPHHNAANKTDSKSRIFRSVHAFDDKQHQPDFSRRSSGNV